MRDPLPRAVGGLFDTAPMWWGLRGDPHLWAEMRRHFESAALPRTAEELAQLVAAAFEELTGRPITHPEHFFVEKYAHGGMSSGHVDPKWWREDAIPLLRNRLAGLPDGQRPS